MNAQSGGESLSAFPGKGEFPKILKEKEFATHLKDIEFAKILKENKKCFPIS